MDREALRELFWIRPATRQLLLGVFLLILIGVVVSWVIGSPSDSAIDCMNRLDSVNRVSRYGEHYRRGEIQEALNACRNSK